MSEFQLFDHLDSATETALRSSIERFGVLVPIAKDQHGRILDGHQRSRIADELGVHYRVDVIAVEGDEAAREIARTLNADRRQLTPAQVRDHVKLHREAGFSQGATAKALGITQQRVSQVESELTSASELTVSERTVGLDGRKRRRPTVVAAKDEREASRARQALAKIDALPGSHVVDVKRAERIAREQEAARRRAKAIAATAVQDAAAELRPGDFRDVLADLDGQADAIVTDPPYERAWIERDAAEFAETAARLLAPAGTLVVMFGQVLHYDLKPILDRELAHRCTGAYLMPGWRGKIWHAKVATGWKPLLVYGRRGDEWQYLTDDVFVSDAADKTFHVWGQSLSGTRQLVERFTRPGQLVIDPFLGGGTTAVVCRDLGRRFVGCDIDEHAIRTTAARLQEAA